MQYRAFGNTSLEVSVLGYGCGAVGGLMVRGEHRDMIRTVQYALESGINYFDTARMYGDGLSEIHTGAVLRELGAHDALVGTKVRLSAVEFDNIFPQFQDTRFFREVKENGETFFRIENSCKDA